MQNTINVWFGDNFSSLDRLIPGLKRTSAEWGQKFGYLWILCSKRQSDSLSGKASALVEHADAFEVEPSTDDMDIYRQWALNTILKYNIQFVVPGRRRKELGLLKEAIEALPHHPKVLTAAELKTLKGLDNKQWTFEFCEEHGLNDLIPFWRPANTPAALDVALNQVRAQGFRRACMKPSVAIYGQGFHFIQASDSLTMGKDLWDTPPHGCSQEQAIELSKSTPNHPTMLCMPMLRCPEISMDCFAQNGVLIGSFSRVKRGRTQRAQTIKLVQSAAERLTKLFNFNGFYNIQMRYEMETGALKLLEINPRLAGGTSYGQSAGFDLVYWSLSYAAGNCSADDFPSIEENKILYKKPSRVLPPLGIPTNLPES
jgi:hypothetical protein